MKRIIAATFFLALMASLGLSVSAESGLDAQLSDAARESAQSYLQHFKDLISQNSATWPLPGGTAIDDVTVDRIFVTYNVDLDKVAQGTAVDDAIRSKNRYTVTTKAKDTPLYIYWVGESGYEGHGESAQYIADAIAKCEKDGNTPTNVIYNLGMDFLLCESSGGEAIVYPVDAFAANLTGSYEPVTLDRLRYNEQVMSAYYKENPQPDGTGGGGKSISTVLASGFAVPDTIKQPVDYTPAESANAKSASASAGESSGFDGSIVWPIAAVMAATACAGFAIVKIGKAKAK